ncbi:hypothetical protein [Fischerella thermalis]|uniref:hypothetical protein n=1 Tax=Fischerella thermalis TaxID=372787 RepID=UPI0011AF3586|nr:hypothetical protein [Fischerella thermalis]
MLHVYGIHRYIATLEHELAHRRHLLDGILCRPGRYDESRVDSDRDGLDDRWEQDHYLHPCSDFSVDEWYPDREVIAYIEGDGKLVNSVNYWEADWADCGLQKGVPRSPFPWKYVEGSREGLNSAYNDLLTEIRRRR